MQLCIFEYKSGPGLQKILRRETLRGIFDGSIFFERARKLEQKQRKAKKMA